MTEIDLPVCTLKAAKGVGLFHALERRRDRIPEGCDVAKFMAEQQRKPGQEQRFALRPGRIDRRRQRLIGGLEVFERHRTHAVSLPRQMPAALSISTGTTAFHRPAMCRSGRSRYNVPVSA